MLVLGRVRVLDWVWEPRLREDLGNNAGADGATTFTDGEAHLRFHRDRVDQFHRDAHVVARHHHFLLQLDGAGDVGGAEIELRAVALEERRVAAAFFLVQDIDFGLELGVGRDAARLAQYLAALEVFLLRAAQQDADVVARAPFVQQLAEHLDARHHGLGGCANTDDLDFLANLHDAAFDAARGDRAATGDGEHVFHRQQERLVDFALRLRDEGVKGVVQLLNLGNPLRLAGNRLGRRTADDRGFVAGKAVLGQQVTNFHFDEVEQLGVVDEVAFVQPDHDLRHVDLFGQQDVLAGLRHRAVGRRNHQDRAVHLRGTRDHVLDVVRMPRAIHVGVMAVLGAVFDVRGRDRENLGRVATTLTLGRLGDLVVGNVRAPAPVRTDLGQRRGGSRLAVIDVANSANVDVGLNAIKLFLGHFSLVLEDSG